MLPRHGDASGSSLVKAYAYRVALIMALLGIAGCFLMEGLRIWHLTRDDAFIYFRYAKNVVHGLGPVFNPGERVEGFSSPLWLVLISILAASRLPLVFLSKVIGIGLAFLTAAVAWRIAVAVGPDRDEGEQNTPLRNVELAAFAGAFLLLDFSVAYYGVSGLETNLAMFLYTLSVYLLVRDVVYLKRPSYLSAAVIGAATWVRPESVLFSILAVGVLVIIFRRRSMRWAALSVTLTSSLFVARFLYYGAPLPNTYYAKDVSLSPGIVARGLSSIVSWSVHYGRPLELLVVAVAIGWLVSARRWQRILILSLPLLTCVALILRVGGDWMRFFRFLNPSYGVLAAVAASGIRLAFRGIRISAIRLAALVIVILGCGFGSYQQMKLVMKRPLSGPEALWVHPVPFFADIPYCSKQLELARWLRKNVPPGALVAHGDMGLTPYLNMDKRFVDYYGLVTPSVSRLKNVHRSATGVMENELDRRGALGRVMVRLRPDVMVVRWRSWRGDEPRPGVSIWDGTYRVVKIVRGVFVVLRRQGAFEGSALPGPRF